MDVKNEYKIRLRVSFGSQAHICRLSAAPCLPIEIQRLSQHHYKVHSFILSATFFGCSGANSPPPSPAPPLIHSQDLVFWYSSWN